MVSTATRDRRGWLTPVDVAAHQQGHDRDCRGGCAWCRAQRGEAPMPPADRLPPALRPADPR